MHPSLIFLVGVLILSLALAIHFSGEMDDRYKMIEEAVERRHIQSLLYDAVDGDD